RLARVGEGRGARRDRVEEMAAFRLERLAGLERYRLRIAPRYCEIVADLVAAEDELLLPGFRVVEDRHRLRTDHRQAVFLHRMQPAHLDHRGEAGGEAEAHRRRIGRL